MGQKISPDSSEGKLEEKQEVLVYTPNHEQYSAKSHTSTSEKEAIFNKLHSAATSRRKAREMNEEIKKRKELEPCTFKPQISNSHSLNRDNNAQNIYDRLASTSKLDKFRYLEAQKERNELQHCTFAPKVTAPRPRSQNSSRQHDNIHTRLHKEGELLAQVRRSKQMAYKNKELDGCTFRPQTNMKMMSASVSSNDLKLDPCERLYQDHEKKVRANAKREADSAEPSEQIYTFHPTLVAKQKFNYSKDQPVHEKLYAKHMQRQLLLEQKRRELAEEQQKMHQFASQTRMTSKENKKLRASSSTKSIRTNPRQNEEAEDIGAFERLHRLHKVEERRKSELAKKILEVFRWHIIINRNKVQLLTRE